MKEFIEKMKNIAGGENKQKLVLFGSIAVVMTIIIVAIAITVKIVGIKITYEELEDKLATTANSYLRDHKEEAPTPTNPTVVISAETLVENKYMKPLKKYVKDASCTANVNVLYNSGTFKYLPFLTCNDFKTEKFAETLKKKNTISSFGEGLYEMNGEFVYRGQNPNNYIKFANKTWRIVKIDKGGNFHLIENKVNYQKTAYWDNRYNSEAKASKGINTYTISRILNTLKNTYEKDYKSYQKYLTPANICVGKRPSAVSFNDGSVECSEIVSGQYLGLLPIYDYLNASLDNACLTVNSKECQNYNYLVDADSNWWTLTANPKSSYSVYYINSSGIVNTDEAAQPKPYRQVIYLNGDTLYKSGTGTASDPYVIR